MLQILAQSALGHGVRILEGPLLESNASIPGPRAADCYGGDDECPGNSCPNPSHPPAAVQQRLLSISQTQGTHARSTAGERKTAFESGPRDTHRVAFAAPATILAAQAFHPLPTSSSKEGKTAPRVILMVLNQETLTHPRTGQNETCYFGHDTMPFASLAAAKGFHKLSPDHSQCKNAAHIGLNTAEWVPGT